MRSANHSLADVWLDCADCKKRNDRATRRQFNCGWLPLSEHKGPGYPQQRGFPQRTDPDDYKRPADYAKACRAEICLGYVIRLPQVCEASRALSHWRNGSLLLRYEGEAPTLLLLDCVEELQASVQASESFIIRAAREG